MRNDRIRTFSALEYGDPRGYLIALANLEPRLAKSELDLKMRTLRTNELKPHRERREAALFCHFMAERMNKQILFAPLESQDFDFVGRWEDSAGVHYVPTQLKEVVPDYLNPRASIDAVIASLGKYTDSAELSVVIHLNKNSNFDPLELSVPKLPLATLWVFWATAPGGKQWAMCGDYLKQPICTEHHYPAA